MAIQTGVDYTIQSGYTPSVLNTPVTGTFDNLNIVFNSNRYTNYTVHSIQISYNSSNQTYYVQFYYNDSSTMFGRVTAKAGSAIVLNSIIGSGTSDTYTEYFFKINFTDNSGLSNIPAASQEFLLRLANAYTESSAISANTDYEFDIGTTKEIDFVQYDTQTLTLNGSLDISGLGDSYIQDFNGKVVNFTSVICSSGSYSENGVVKNYYSFRFRGFNWDNGDTAWVTIDNYLGPVRGRLFLDDGDMEATYSLNSCKVNFNSAPNLGNYQTVFEAFLKVIAPEPSTPIVQKRKLYIFKNSTYHEVVGSGSYETATEAEVRALFGSGTSTTPTVTFVDDTQWNDYAQDLDHREYSIDNGQTWETIPNTLPVSISSNQIMLRLGYGFSGNLKPKAVCSAIGLDTDYIASSSSQTQNYSLTEDATIQLSVLYDD